MTFQFEIPGEPRGKGRPRFARTGKYVRTYTDDKTVAYENLVRVSYCNAGGPMFPKDAALCLSVIVYMKIPESTSKKRKALMLSDEIRPTKKPDADNILNAILDGLNTVAYHDDAQIVDLYVRRYYSDRPRCVVGIWNWNGED